MARKSEKEKANNLILNLKKIDGILSSKQVKNLILDLVNNSGLFLKNRLITFVSKKMDNEVNQYHILNDTIQLINNMYNNEDTNNNK